MADIDDTKAAQSVKIMGSEPDGTEQTAVSSTDQGRLKVDSINTDVALSVCLDIMSRSNTEYDTACRVEGVDGFSYEFYAANNIVETFLVTGTSPEWCVERFGLLLLEDGDHILTESGDRLRWV